MKKKSVYLFGISSFFNDISSELLQAILPNFLVYIGMPYPLIGFITGIREFSSKVFMSIGGVFSKRFGRKKTVFLGYATSSLFKLFIPFTTSFSLILTLAFERIGKSIREAPRDSMLSDYKNKGEAFGIHRSLDTFGAIIGVLAAYFLINQFSFESLLFLAALVGFLSLIPLIFIKEENKKKKITKRNYEKEKFKIFSIIISLYYMGNISYAFLILYSQKIFSLENSILLYFLFNMVYMLLAIPMGKKAEKKTPMVIMSFGLISFITSMLFFIIGDFISIILGFLFYGISYAMIEGNRRYYLSTISKNPEIIGNHYTLIGISSIIGNSIAGYLFSFNPKIMFLYSTILIMMSFTFAYKWRGRL